MNAPPQSDVRFETVCQDCDALCKNCDLEGKKPMCVEELDHSSSQGGNTTVEMLLIEPGYWRSSSTSTNILACYNADACRGGVTGADDYCREGYEGPCKLYTTCFKTLNYKITNP